MVKGFGFSIPRFWTPRRRARIESVAAEAEALVRELGDAAYFEARRREHEASSDAMAEDWSRVALAVARLLGSRVDQAAKTDGGSAAPPAHRNRPAPGRRGEARPALEARPQPFRIQYVGEWSDRGASILKEAEIQVLDVSAAIVEAANLPWPPGTIALRILDREGREVFERHRADRQ